MKSFSTIGVLNNRMRKLPNIIIYCCTDRYNEGNTNVLMDVQTYQQMYKCTDGYKDV